MGDTVLTFDVALDWTTRLNQHRWPVPEALTLLRCLQEGLPQWVWGVAVTWQDGAAQALFTVQTRPEQASDARPPPPSR